MSSCPQRGCWGWPLRARTLAMHTHVSARERARPQHRYLWRAHAHALSPRLTCSPGVVSVRDREGGGLRAAGSLPLPRVLSSPLPCSPAVNRSSSLLVPVWGSGCLAPHGDWWVGQGAGHSRVWHPAPQPRVLQGAVSSHPYKPRTWHRSNRPEPPVGHVGTRFLPPTAQPVCSVGGCPVLGGSPTPLRARGRCHLNVDCSEQDKPPVLTVRHRDYEEACAPLCRRGASAPCSVYVVKGRKAATPEPREPGKLAVRPTGSRRQQAL